jgi:hypothetical protein
VTTPDETLTRFAEAVVAWHELLVELATDARGRFAVVAPIGTGHIGDPPAWQAVTQLPYVVHYDPRPDRVPHPKTLSWADVDPTARIFEPGTIEVSDLPTPETDWRLRDLWLENLTLGLVDRHGLWAVGWRWSNGEADLDGGPVSSWCCFEDSVTTPAATAATIGAALGEWHDWLVEVAERFDRFLPLSADDLDGWERAVAHLVTAVGDRTQYESAWYGCCRTVLGWFLESAGIEAGRRPELLDHAIGGRFESWVEPPTAVVEAIAEDVARRVGR